VQPGGVLESSFGTTPGYGFAAVILTLTYLWLPYMILPGVRRLRATPEVAPGGLGGPGAKGLYTFRRVILPALLPSIAAGTVFTFSLSLGDYIAVQIVGGTLQVARHHGAAEHHPRPCPSRRPWARPRS
jgi:putative spermidine/putrescine transport system permease protein